MSKTTPRILGLIPARGGSKGIINKNIVKLNDQPLIAYTICAAKQSSFLNDIIVSTDSQQIADIALEFGAKIPFLRPSKLATDSSGAVGVVEHCIDFFKANQHVFDYIVYLQPTSPLRSADDIDQAINVILQSDADSLVSVIDVPHQFGIESLMTEQSDSQEKWLTPISDDNAFSRQKKPHYVARNGPAILITKPETIKQFGNLYGNKIASYKMPIHRSIDIDGPEDLDYASWLIQRR